MNRLQFSFWRILAGRVTPCAPFSANCLGFRACSAHGVTRPAFSHKMRTADEPNGAQVRATASWNAAVLCRFSVIALQSGRGLQLSKTWQSAHARVHGKSFGKGNHPGAAGQERRLISWALCGNLRPWHDIPLIAEQLPKMKSFLACDNSLPCTRRRMISAGCWITVTLRTRPSSWLATDTI